MSGGKACGKQAAQYADKQPDEGSVVTRRDKTAPENEEHSSDRTHRKSMRLKEMSAAKQAGGKGETEKGKQPAAQKKRTRTTRQATETQPLLLAADAFAATLAAVPAEDWCWTWAAGRTIMLRSASKTVKEVVDKMRLPAVVRLSTSFWDDARRNGTEKEKRQFVLWQLTAMTARCSDTTLELRNCAITGPHAEWLAGGVLAQCRVLVHLDLSNRIGDAGAESPAGVLAQCPTLSHLELSCNGIDAVGKREASSFVAWSSLWSYFVGTLHCLLFPICIADRQQERATYCTQSPW